MTYQIGETVLYGVEGVCTIAGTEHRDMAGMKLDYYVLQPVYNRQSKVLVPLQNPQLVAKMQPLLSAEEINELIRSMPSGADLPWEENDTLRREQFKEILLHGDRRAVICLIKTLYLHQQALAEKGKKQHAADDRFFKDAEKKLYEEFAYVLHLEREQVLPFILEQIREQERNNQS